MYVCICNALKERDVRRVAAACVTPGAVYRALGCAARCGRCVPTVRGILAESPAPRVDAPVAQPAAFALAAE